MTSNYKQLLIELENLSHEAKATVFRRAQIIVALVKDPEYAHFLHTDDEGEVRRKLSRYISELGVSVDDVIVMLEFAPQQETWSTTPLRELRDLAYASRVKRGLTDRKRPTGTLIEKLRKQIDDLKKQLAVERHEKRTLARRLHAIEKSITSV
jgi:hypothetical protein